MAEKYLIRSQLFGYFIGFRTDEDVLLFSAIEPLGYNTAMGYHSHQEAMQCATNEIGLEKNSFTIVPVSLGDGEQPTAEWLCSQRLLHREDIWFDLLRRAANIKSRFDNIGLPDHVMEIFEQIKWDTAPHKSTYQVA